MGIVRELKIKAYKLRREKRKKKYSKFHLPIIISLIVGIAGPWLLTYIFLVSLEIWPNLKIAVDNDPKLLFTMIIFYSFNFTYELPILGGGFWLVFVIWAIPGLFIGLINRKIKISLVYAFVGLSSSFFLYAILINYRMFGINLPFEFIDPLVSPNLYSNFGVHTLYYLFQQITIQSFAFPLIILFALIGSLINPKLMTISNNS
ncbi:MAG: hypothetical protein ACFFD5_13820 [Candidatus Thorarchaeota archaeon]